MIQITATPTAGGFTNSISFSVSGLPAGATASFNPAMLQRSRKAHNVDDNDWILDCRPANCGRRRFSKAAPTAAGDLVRRDTRVALLAASGSRDSAYEALYGSCAFRSAEASWAVVRWMSTRLAWTLRS